jgi:tetratricopeptide (TPR) repeat protein
VDKSLLGADDGRFRYVDTIRQFADERLAASGERGVVACRHLEWCLALARDNDPTAVTGGRPLHTLEADHDNLRAALTFALRDDPQEALALASHLWRFWLDRSWFVEGTAWMDAVLDAAPERTALRVEALLAAAGLALRRGDADAYMQRLDETLAVVDQLDDPAAAVAAHVQHALFEAYINASDRSARLSEQAIATAERIGRPDLAASASQAAALAAWQRSDVTGAILRLEGTITRLRALRPRGAERFFEAVTFGMPPRPEGPDGAVRLVWESTMFPFRRLDATQALGLALNNLAWTRRAVGADGVDPRDALEEALGRFRAAGDRSGEALTLAHLGHLARSRGDCDDARARLEAALALRQELGERRDAGLVMLGLGLVEAQEGDLASSRATFGAALRRFEATDDLPAMAGARMNWAIVEERDGDPLRARDLYAEGAALWTRQRLPRAAAWGAVGHAATLAALDDDAAAEAVRAEARASFVALGDRLGIATLDAQGDPLRNAR